MILLKMFLLCEEVISILRNTAYCYFVKVSKVYQSNLVGSECTSGCGKYMF